MKDFGFAAFKDQVAEFDRSLEWLKEGRLNIENPGALFCGINKHSDEFEGIRGFAARFKRALKAVSGLEFKIDWSMTDSCLNVKFENGNNDDIHDKIRQVFRGEERRPNARDASTDDFDRGGKLEKRKSFLDHPVNGSSTPNIARRESQFLPLRAQATMKSSVGMRDSLFSNIDPVEDRRPSLLISRPGMSDSRWGESEGGMDDFDFPSLKSSMHAGTKATSTPDQSDNFVRKMTMGEPSTPNTKTSVPLKPASESLAIKPSATKAYVSQRKLQLDGLYPPTPESQRVLGTPANGGCELGIISNQAIDETKFKLIMAELRSSQRMFERIEFVNNTFKCNCYKLLRLVIGERMSCEVKIDESKNKWQVKTKLTKKEIAALKDMNITVLQI